MGEGDSKTPKVRLKFIDLARSLAILLMLEGHFVGLTLKDMDQYAGHPVFEVWNTIRGLTAPLFFTVAGMIFIYLLEGEKEAAFHKRVRVRKGLWRAVELVFWGYALQLSVGRFPAYLQGDFESWVAAFHVLQCIGAGLLALLLIAGLRAATGKFPLQAWYAVAMVICLGIYAWLKGMPDHTYVPQGWPQVFQNAVKGPRSVFPVAPWLAFTFFGGAMGAYLHSIKDRPADRMSWLWLFIVAAAFTLARLALSVLPQGGAVAGLGWFMDGALRIAIFLGLLRWLEIRRGIGIEWMLRVGRETFAIYIVHVIVLYGGITGFGIDDWLKGRLNPLQATAGAALFISAFIAHALLLNAWKSRKKYAGIGVSNAS